MIRFWSELVTGPKASMQDQGVGGAFLMEMYAPTNGQSPQKGDWKMGELK